MYKNDIDLLSIKSINQEDTINIMEREIEELNREHSNEIEQIRNELSNNQSLMNHYKGSF